jgi:hypothetical protein
MEQIAERVGGNDLLGDRNLFAPDCYRADAELGPLMRHAGVREQLHRSRSTSYKGRIPNERPRLAENTPESFGQQPDWKEHVIVYLVGLIKHEPSYASAAPRIESILKVETLRRFDQLLGDRIPSQKSRYFKNILVLTIIWARAMGRQGGWLLNRLERSRRVSWIIVMVADFAGGDTFLPILPAN